MELKFESKYIVVQIDDSWLPLDDVSLLTIHVL